MKTMLLLSLCLLTGSMHARSPEQLDRVQREARIVADVIESALRSELRSQARVNSVEAEYLAQQGVLVSVNLNRPWLVVSDYDSDVEIDGHITIPEIPRMVTEILHDLQINVATPFEPEALEELRELRNEQRELRLEQRKIRGKLRQERRELVRADDDDKRQKVAEDITELERELAALDAQYEALASDIQDQYQRLSDYRAEPEDPTRVTKVQDLDALIARTACDYGGTLRSLSSQQFLTIALRRGDRTDYYAFKMGDVQNCSQQRLSSDKLLELGYLYSG